MKSSGHTDTVVVGAGAAGCLIAARLAEAGQRVTVLEAGPPWEPGDLWSSQIWARRLKWRGSPVTVTGANPIAHNLSTGSGFGGAALHHYGTWPRFTTDVFDAKRADGRRAWPFDYEALRQAYDQVQSEVGLSGDARAEVWRPPGEPYPMPPLESFRHGQLLRDGFRSLGLPVAPLPLAINSRSYRGRSPCLYDGWCDAGCPIGALGNPLFTYLPRARAAGADFRSGCEVTRVITDRTGRATGVEFITDDVRGRLSAGHVVLAASVVQNARLLLNSTGPRHARGLGNGSDQVGRGVVAEVGTMVFGLFAEPTENHRGVSAGQFMHRGAVANPAVPDAPTGHQWQIGPALKPNDIFGIASSRPELWGTKLQSFIERAARSLASMIGFGGGFAHPENRIMTAARRDRFGSPIAEVRHRFTDAQLALWRFMSAQGEAVLRAAGATELWSARPATGHLVGGTLMGQDSSDSVVDESGRLYECHNVVIAGAGLIPFSGGISPTFTLMALAHRSAARLLSGSLSAAVRNEVASP